MRDLISPFAFILAGVGCWAGASSLREALVWPVFIGGAVLLATGLWVIVGLSKPK